MKTKDAFRKAVGKEKILSVEMLVVVLVRRLMVAMKHMVEEYSSSSPPKTVGVSTGAQRETRNFQKGKSAPAS